MEEPLDTNFLKENTSETWRTPSSQLQEGNSTISNAPVNHWLQSNNATSNGILTEHLLQDYNTTEEDLSSKPAFEANNTPVERTLIDHLLRDYSPLVRPTLNSSQPIVVNVYFELILIDNLDERHQIMTTFMWVCMDWHDDLLLWNPYYYQGILDLNLPSSKVWLPDVLVQNSATEMYGNLFNDKFHISAWYDGTVSYCPAGQIKSLCQMDMRFFPFDIQTCDIVLASWVYHVSQIRLKSSMKNISRQFATKSGQWEILYTSVSAKFTNLGGTLYPELHATLVLQRKPLYYLVYVVVPSMLMSGVSLLVFWIPPDSGEKISTGITVLLSFSIFQLLLLNLLPATSENMPVLGIYVEVVMCCTALSIALSVLVTNLHYKSKMLVPKWLSNVLVPCLAKVLCMELKTPQSVQYSNNKEGSSDKAVEINEFAVTFQHKPSQEQFKDCGQSTPNSNNVVVDWTKVANVLDRFFFCIIAMTDIVLGLGFFLYSAKRYYE